MVDDLAALRFERLGHPVLNWDHLPPVIASKDRPHQLLVVLVEFSDQRFDRFAQDPKQGEKLAAHYQTLLFDPSYARQNTLSHFYLQQSLGRYHLQGRILPPVRLAHPRAHYGSPYRQKGGEWRNDRDPQGMVEEALTAAFRANPDLDWSAFDRWDPKDFDGDEHLNEGDGYLDHFVIVYAGGAQSSCQSLHKLRRKLNPNVQQEALKSLNPQALECAERIWPHRFVVQRREAQGPWVEGRRNLRGGVSLSDTLWGLDYNAQSEYTDVSTFIHEFGHSIGLPDLYARQSSNSTGVWDLMSNTSSPAPQNLSAWSRLALGWLRPRIIRPPAFRGKKTQSIYLRLLDDPSESPAQEAAQRRDGLYRSALVILPPKIRNLRLSELPENSGAWALYSGQGNDLNRSARFQLKVPSTGPARLSFDAWWEIEAGWDFAYLELSADEGKTWTRLVSEDRRFMPAKHGHDGHQSLPGFTGYSGDLDGDGKNENAPGCDPEKLLAHGEDRTGKENPCLKPTWVQPSFRLDQYAGREVQIRLRYFTDGAAVMRGLLVDNFRMEGTPLQQDFEQLPIKGWRLDGFNRSAGQHQILVPHYYLMEFRDPYTKIPGVERYDENMAEMAGYTFFKNFKTGEMNALRFLPRPGVLVWYFDGAYAWSENDPSQNGPGKGFALVLDAQPEEYSFPGLETWYQAQPQESHYKLKSELAQKHLEALFRETSCFVRNPLYRPAELKLSCPPGAAALSKLKLNGRSFLYSYEVYDRLPGPARDVIKAGELYDYKELPKGAGLSWRLRDRGLRYAHTLDAAFALKPFPRGIEIFEVTESGLKSKELRAHPGVSRFSDAAPSRWLNPNLPFGGLNVPEQSFGFELSEPGPQAPKRAQVKIWFLWR